MEDPRPSWPSGRSGSVLGIPSFVANLVLTKIFLIWQKMTRFNYGSDEEIMDRRRMQREGGNYPTVGEKSQGVASPIVTREEGPAQQPKPIELMESLTAFLKKGALLELYFREDVSRPAFQNTLKRKRDESQRRIYARKIPHVYTLSLK